MENKTQELYDRMADSVRVLPEGAEPSPGALVIDVGLTEEEVKSLIRDIPKNNGTTKRQEITGEELPSEEEKQIRAMVQAQKEKNEREQKCNQALQQALVEHNCDLGAFFNAGQQLIPTLQLVTLPVVIKSVAK